MNSRAGELYLPSNGTEGECFWEAYCFRCKNEKWSHTQREGDLKCEIMSRTMCEGKQPEWIYNEKGTPTCTAWVLWDWDKDDPENPDGQPPPPDDPNQLCFPFLLDEILNQKPAQTDHGLLELV